MKRDNTITLLLDDNHKIWLKRDQDGVCYVLSNWKTNTTITSGQLVNDLVYLVDNIMDATKYRKAKANRDLLKVWFQSTL